MYLIIFLEAVRYNCLIYIYIHMVRPPLQARIRLSLTISQRQKDITKGYNMPAHIKKKKLVNQTKIGRSTSNIVRFYGDQLTKQRDAIWETLN